MRKTKDILTCTVEGTMIGLFETAEGHTLAQMEVLTSKGVARITNNKYITVSEDIQLSPKKFIECNANPSSDSYEDNQMAIDRMYKEGLDSIARPFAKQKHSMNASPWEKISLFFSRIAEKDINGESLVQARLPDDYFSAGPDDDIEDDYYEISDPHLFLSSLLAKGDKPWIKCTFALKLGEAQEATRKLYKDEYDKEIKYAFIPTLISIEISPNRNYRLDTIPGYDHTLELTREAAEAAGILWLD